MTTVERLPNEECFKLPDIKGIYEGKFTDRNPNMRTAGKLTATGETAKQCMKGEEPKSKTPDIVTRFRNYVKPDYGKKTIHYGQAYDPHLEWAKDMVHGAVSKPSHIAGDLLNPPPQSKFRQAKLEKKEGIYESHQRKPLGTFPNPEKNFPEGMDYEGKVYGIKSEKGHRAKESLNPSKNYDKVEKEYDDRRDLYRFSHKSYNAGEQKQRSYTAPPYDRGQNYGKPTPHDNAGKLTAKSLKWIDQCCGKETTPVVQKRIDGFRERTQPQLGKPLDPIKDTMNVPDDHTFGVMLQPDEYGVGDLLHGRAPKHYLRGQERERGLIAAVRSNLKKANYQNFNNLIQAFCLYDPEGKGYITAIDLKNVCEQFQLPIELELLVQLFDYCDIDRDGRINYIEFSNFLNWKDKLPTGLPDRINSADHFHKRLQKQIDKAIVDQKTSSQMINAAVGGVSTKAFRSYGVPSIRNDLAAPKIKKCDDRTNYGDESDAFGLLQPSIFSRYGVYERDMLAPKSRDEIKEIFSNAGLKITEEDFENLYEQAASKSSDGSVGVEGFRIVVDSFLNTHIEVEREAMEEKLSY